MHKNVNPYSKFIPKLSTHSLALKCKNSTYTQTYQHYPHESSRILSLLQGKKETCVLYICHKVDNFVEKTQKMSKVYMS